MNVVIMKQIYLDLISLLLMDHFYSYYFVLFLLFTFIHSLSLLLMLLVFDRW